MPSRDNMFKLSESSITQLDVQNYKIWRAQAAEALEAAGLLKEAEYFRSCSRHYDVDVCIQSVDHAPRAVPYTCHQRFCPDCEKREQARKLERFVSPVHDMMLLGESGYTLKHIVLTTPYGLADVDAPERYKNAWTALEKLLNRLFYTLLDDDNKLSAKEERRGEVSLKAHGIGILAAAEFGEDGQKLHFHLLAYCPFIPKRFLSWSWSKVTDGDAEVSYLEKIDLENAAKAVIEVAKYVTKFSELPPALVPALAKAINGSRRLRTYGIMQGLGKKETGECRCPVCSAERQLVGIMTYIRRCEAAGLALDDSIVNKVEESYKYS